MVVVCYKTTINAQQYWLRSCIGCRDMINISGQHSTAQHSRFAGPSCYKTHRHKRAQVQCCTRIAVHWPHTGNAQCPHDCQRAAPIYLPASHADPASWWTPLSRRTLQLDGTMCWCALQQSVMDCIFALLSSQLHLEPHALIHACCHLSSLCTVPSATQQ